MKPLVLWARWHDAKIEFHGRTPEKVWGVFNYWKEERKVPFEYVMVEKKLETEGNRFTLDEAGVVISDKPSTEETADAS